MLRRHDRHRTTGNHQSSHVVEAFVGATAEARAERGKRRSVEAVANVFLRC